MRYRLFKTNNADEERVDIYYYEKNELTTKLIALIENSDKDESIYGIDEKNKKVIILYENIFYFEYVDKRVFAYLENTVYLVKEQLGVLEEKLRPFGFIRVNKSTIVNIYHIESIKPEINMRVKAILDNGETLVINRSYKKDFERYLKERRQIHEQ